MQMWKTHTHTPVCRQNISCKSDYRWLVFHCRGMNVFLSLISFFNLSRDLSMKLTMICFCFPAHVVLSSLWCSRPLLTSRLDTEKKDKWIHFMQLIQKGNPNDRREEFPTLCLFQQLYALVKYLIPMFKVLLGPYWELDCDYHLSLSLLSQISVCFFVFS